MRAAILLLGLMMLGGCAASRPTEDDFITQVGIIEGKDVIDPEGSQGNNQGQ